MKVYEYKGKLYCDKDLSLTNDNYNGDRYDLYFELRDDCKASEDTTYRGGSYENVYDSIEELIDEEFTDLCIGEVEE